MFWSKKNQESKETQTKQREDILTKQQLFDQIVKDEGYVMLDGYYAQILYKSMEKMFDPKVIDKMRAEGKSLEMDVKLIDTYTSLAYAIDAIVARDEDDGTYTETTLLYKSDLVEFFREEELKYLAIILVNYTNLCNVDHVKVAMNIAENALTRKRDL
jgi:hypothetical protein